MSTSRSAGIIQPGGTLGVLGSGQLGRMFALAARRMGYRVHVFSPDSDTPAGQVSDCEFRAPYEDTEQVARFARSVDAVTLEFEHIPAEAARIAARYVPMRPSADVLHTTQHRLREKTFLRDAGLPVAPFEGVGSLQELESAVARLGLPAVLKTCSWGYDGKGQVLLGDIGQLDSAWRQLDTREAILERFVDFEQEISVVAARGADGSIVAYEPFLNQHRHHILDISICPAPLPPHVARDAVEMAHTVLQRLELVGVLCVEFFVTGEGGVLINELAPRPHNSGHLTIDAHATCQFEQQVRAACCLPLGAPTRLRPAAMANLLGDLWFPETPRWERACRMPDVKLHLYGKREPRRGRKMGHLTALAETPEIAWKNALAARADLSAGSPSPASVHDAVARAKN